MLTMSFVYLNIWQIKQTTPKDFAMGMIGFGKDVEKSLLEATSPFVFSTVTNAASCASSSLSPATTARSAPTPSWWMTATNPPTPTAISQGRFRPSSKQPESRQYRRLACG
jgi:hypothetical protein